MTSDPPPSREPIVCSPRAALAALPARFEGIFRQHMIIEDVGVRDSAYYSVIDEEWPAIRENLERRLKAARQRHQRASR